jgi:two-component system sensor histidine kinase YesM
MRFHSIRTRLIALLLVATIIPVLLSMWITYAYTKESLKNRSVRENENLLFQAKTNLVNYMNTLNQTSFLVYNAPQQPNSNPLLRIMQTGADDYQSRGELYTALQNISHAVKEIFQVRLYMETNKLTTLIVHDSSKRSVQEDNEIKFPPGVDSYVEASHPSSYYGMQQQFPYYPPETVISMHRQIYDVPSKKVLGSLSIDVRLDVIRSVCEQLVAAGQEQLYLLDGQGRVVFATDPLPNDAALTQGLQRAMSGTAQEAGSFDWGKATHIFQRIETPYMNWTIVKRIPDEFLYANARELTGIQTGIAIVSLLFIIAATLLISVKITSPLKRLIGAITKIQTANLDVRIDGIDSKDEIGVLAQRFQTMMNTINDLILREFKLELANKTNELKALQAQINPHFLNNALQSIGTLALQHDAPRIYSLISSLARMMRYSMTTGETIVPLAKELEHVKAYLALQQQRFDRVQLEYELEEAALDVRVPKMILQPIAENYFKYGFEANRPEPGKLKITGAVRDGMLRIAVANDGLGIPPDKLPYIRAEIRRVPEPGEAEEDGIGLRNVLQRLQLYYRERADLHIDNIEEGGVCVTLFIPADSTDGPNREEMTA